MQVPKSPSPPACGSSLPFVFYVLYYILHRNSHRIVDNVELLWHLCGLLDMDCMVSLFLHLLDDSIPSFKEKPTEYIWGLQFTKCLTISQSNIKGYNDSKIIIGVP